jgi:predicted transposase/invertase (TIGR01784 family)
MEKWYNKTSRRLIPDIQEIHVLELPKLPDDDGTQLWRWLKLMKAREEHEMEALAKGNAEMEKVVMTVRYMSANEYERRVAEEAEKRRRDAIGAINFARDEGKAETKAEIVRRMKSNGVDTATISQYTGIPESEIDTIV